VAAKTPGVAGRDTGKDTFRRVLGLLPSAAFQQCFQQWLQTLQMPADEDSRNNSTQDRRQGVALGRTIARGLGPMYIVSAWASDFGITLGQAATEEKSNEITAIPQLLEQIDVEDAIVTIDAPDARRRLPRRSCKEKATTSWAKAIKRSSCTTWNS
jgi:hypothetical protein